MKIAVGSTNPTKINAARIAFEKVFPQETIEVIGVTVDSGIPNQPMNHQQTIQGAINRAKAALEKTQADFGVGEEGGMQRFDFTTRVLYSPSTILAEVSPSPKGRAQGKEKLWFETGWCCVVDNKGTVGIGSSIHMEVPPRLMKHIHEGKELGVATDIAFKVIDAGKKMGFFGLMTNGHIDRTIAYADGIITALSRFLHPQLF